MIDVVCMDFKLPSSSLGQADFWTQHQIFLSKLKGLEVIIKAVITDLTKFDDMKKISEILKNFDGEYSVILQPVTGIEDKIKSPDTEMLDIFKAFLKKELNKNINVVGQFHKMLNIR